MSRRLKRISKLQQDVKQSEQEVLDYEAKVKAAKEQTEELNKIMYDECIELYRSSALRKQLIDQAKNTTFSKERIERAEQYLDEWNTDIVTDEVLKEFIDMERHIEKSRSIKERTKKFFESSASKEIDKMRQNGGESIED